MQVSPTLRASEGAFVHWCPGCKGMHLIPVGAPYRVNWSFNGDVNRPTFGPSVKHSWGNDECCHYFIRDGLIDFCADSTHEFAGQNGVPLPLLSEARCSE